MRESGFTLVEMLVALAVFAVIAGAGLGLLRASVDTQSAVDRRLADVRELGRLQALLAGDLGQAVARPAQPGSAGRGPFAGETGRMAFTRTGWTNLDGSPRSELQRLEWRLDSRRLVRRAMADRAVDAVFAKDLQFASIRYRRDDGRWASAFASTPVEPLPAAVELSFARSGELPVTIVLAVGPRGPAPQPRIAS